MSSTFYDANYQLLITEKFSKIVMFELFQYEGPFQIRGGRRSLQPWCVMATYQCNALDWCGP